MKKAKFSIDVISDVYEGYTTGQRWNGWEMPYLPKSEVLRFLANEPFSEDDDISFRWDGINLIEISKADECEDIAPMMIIDGEIHYQLGNGWVWEIARERQNWDDDDDNENTAF
jgi:hypothetical protein